MPTANTFAPVVGSLDEPFAIVSGDDTTIPRDPTANLQGDPRPGVLRWVLLLSTPDASANSDDEFKITIPVPDDFELDADIFATEFNLFFPSFSLVAANSATAIAFTPSVALTGVDVDNRTIEVGMTINNAAAAGSWTLTINFCHSAVN